MPSRHFSNPSGPRRPAPWRDTFAKRCTKKNALHHILQDRRWPLSGTRSVTVLRPAPASQHLPDHEKPGSHQRSDPASYRHCPCASLRLRVPPYVWSPLARSACLRMFVHVCACLRYQGQPAKTTTPNSTHNPGAVSCTALGFCSRRTDAPIPMATRCKQHRVAAQMMVPELCLVTGCEDTHKCAVVSGILQRHMTSENLA